MFLVVVLLGSHTNVQCRKNCKYKRLNECYQQLNQTDGSHKRY